MDDRERAHGWLKNVHPGNPRWCEHWADSLAAEFAAVRAEAQAELLHAIDNAAGQTTDPLCREALSAVLDRFNYPRVPGIE